MRLIITKQWELFTVCTEHAASGQPKPTRLEWKVRFIQAQDQQVLPHIVCVFALLSYDILQKQKKEEEEEEEERTRHRRRVTRHGY